MSLHSVPTVMFSAVDIWCEPEPKPEPGDGERRRPWSPPQVRRAKLPPGPRPATSEELRRRILERDAEASRD